MITLRSKDFFCLLLLSSLGLCFSALFFPTNTAYGIFGAISVPLDLPNNVFLSYNFESNYNLPATWYLPQVLKGREAYEYYSPRKIDGVNIMKEVRSNEPKNQSLRKSLLSRLDFYRVLNDKFSRSGLSGGEACLLRLICEFNNESAELANINGILGSIMRVILSPSSSANETNLSVSYIAAEILGVIDQCFHYKENCSESILNLFSSSVDDILYELMKNK